MMCGSEEHVLNYSEHNYSVINLKPKSRDKFCMAINEPEIPFNIVGKEDRREYCGSEKLIS